MTCSQEISQIADRLRARGLVAGMTGDVTAALAGNWRADLDRLLVLAGDVRVMESRLNEMVEAGLRRASVGAGMVA